MVLSLMLRSFAPHLVPLPELGSQSFDWFIHVRQVLHLIVQSL